MLRAARFASQLGFAWRRGARGDEDGAVLVRISAERVAAIDKLLVGRSGRGYRPDGGRAVRVLCSPELDADGHRRTSPAQGRLSHFLTVLRQAIALEDDARIWCCAGRSCCTTRVRQRSVTNPRWGEISHHHEVVGAKMVRKRCGR